MQLPPTSQLILYSTTIYLSSTAQQLAWLHIFVFRRSMSDYKRSEQVIVDIDT